MLYSMAPASALVITLILNLESIKKYGFREKKQDEKKRVPVRFNCFILASVCYVLIDMAWGLLYEHHDIPELFPFIYSSTVFYFLFMLLTMLTWTRYIVAYLDKRGFRTALMLHGVWTMFMIGIICLVLNNFSISCFHIMMHLNISESPEGISLFFCRLHSIQSYRCICCMLHIKVREARKSDITRWRLQVSSSACHLFFRYFLRFFLPMPLDL